MVEINVARLIGATEECACGPSGSQPRQARRENVLSVGRSPFVADGPRAIFVV